MTAQRVLFVFRAPLRAERRQGVAGYDRQAAQAVGSLPGCPRDRLVHGLPQHDGSAAAQMCGNLCASVRALPCQWPGFRDEFVVGSGRTATITCHHVMAAYADVSVEHGPGQQIGRREAVVGGGRFSGLAVDVG